MFQFGPSSSEINRCFREVAAWNTAIVTLLIEKGIATEKEVLDTRLKAIAQVDQALAEARQEQIDAMDEKDRMVYDLLNKALGGDP